MRASVYARYSSEGQREASIEDQVRECTETIRRRGWTVAAVYEDKALSGQLGEEQRPGFRAMMEAAQRRAFEVLVVDDTSRLSRNMADALHLFERLRFWGVHLVARDGIDTLAGSKHTTLLYGVRGIINAEYVRTLAEATRRGLEGQVRRGYNPGGCPFGYRSTPVTENGIGQGSRLVAYEPEAEVVRRIFRLRVSDGEQRPLSLREIAYRLNKEGVPPPGRRWKNRSQRQAATWSFTAVRQLLRNPIYAGRLIWNRTEWVRHPDTRRRLRRPRPKDDWVERQDESLRIVSDELWQRVQERAMEARLLIGVPPHRLHGRARYLLSGFVRCGVCGAHYIIANKTSYRCSASRNRGPVACPNAIPVSRRRLEAAVLAALQAQLYTPATLTTVVAKVRAGLRRRAEEYRRQVEAQDTAWPLAQVEAEIQNLTAAIAMGEPPTALLEALREKERQREVLRASAGGSDSVAAIQARLAKTLEQLPALVEHAIVDLRALMAVQQVEKGKELLALLVEGVVLHPVGGGLEAEIRGNVQGLLKLQTPGKRPGPECKLGGSGGRI